MLIECFVNILNKADDFIFLVSCLFKELIFTYPTAIEANDLKLRNEMRCAIKRCYHLGKTALETVQLMKEAYIDKCFNESTFLDGIAIS